MTILAGKGPGEAGGEPRCAPSQSHTLGPPSSHPRLGSAFLYVLLPLHTILIVYINYSVTIQ